MVVYLTIKINELLMYAMTWMNLGHIVLSGRTQLQKSTYSIIILLI